MVNRVTLVGSLGKDPEVRTLENGTKVASFSLATSESYKDKNDTWQNLTTWHNVVAWRGLADRAEKLSKGVTVYVEGKISHREYTDKDGNKRTTTDIVASSLVSMVKSEKSSSSASNEVPLPVDDLMPF
jgi:single-strand DNA-binding protein